MYFTESMTLNKARKGEAMKRIFQLVVLAIAVLLVAMTLTSISNAQSYQMQKRLTTRN
jgi:Tfp pilus assembly protein PilX